MKIFKNKNMAARLRLAMKKKGIASEDLCKKTSISPFILAKYVDGFREIEEPDATALAKALDVTKDWLMSRDNDTALEVALCQGEDKHILNDDKWKAVLAHAKLLEKEYKKQ